MFFVMSLRLSDHKMLNIRHFTTRHCLVISVKTIVNSVPLKKSYQETLNQYLNNILNGHSIQFLKLSVQNIEELKYYQSSRRLSSPKRGESSA